MDKKDSSKSKTPPKPAPVPPPKPKPGRQTDGGSSLPPQRN